jgi:hypothetical protein
MSEDVPSWFIKTFTDTVHALARQRDKPVAQ